MQLCKLLGLLPAAITHGGPTALVVQQNSQRNTPAFFLAAVTFHTITRLARGRIIAPFVSSGVPPGGDVAAPTVVNRRGNCCSLGGWHGGASVIDGTTYHNQQE